MLKREALNAVAVDNTPAALLQSVNQNREDFHMADPVLIQKDGEITTITLNRPEAGNRQTDATWAQVTEMLNEAAKTRG